VQAYAAIGFFLLAIFLLFSLPVRRQAGDVAGLCLLGLGAVIYFTEMWRDPEGRGSIFHGAIDGPQIAAVLMVIAGGLVLCERKTGPSGLLTFSPHNVKNDGAGEESSERGNA
jgi:phosphatidylglycerol---prolipoprotein diacylglyceryl transferase